MKRLLFLLIVTGCAPQPSAPSLEVYQNATEARCGFRPSTDSVQKILAQNEILSDPNAMALAICSAVMHLGSERKTYYAPIPR